MLNGNQKREVRQMSVSIHINGKNLKDFGSGIQHHQERFNEAEGEQVLRNSDSKINVSQTIHNQLLFKSSKIKDKTVRKYIGDEFRQLNENLSNEGQRRKKKDSNVVGVGTLQVSDDSLKALGYDKSKLWSEQSEQAKKNVFNVYGAMTNVVASDKKMYGELLTATLHVDESTPHVDFVVSGVDSQNKDFTMRSVLNGSKGYGRGKKLSEMQDHLANGVSNIFGNDKAEKFSLQRGETNVAKRDKLFRLKELEAELKSKEIELKEYEERLAIKENEMKKHEKECIIAISDGLKLGKNADSYSDLKIFSDALKEYFNRIKKKAFDNKNGRKRMQRSARVVQSTSEGSKTSFKSVQTKNNVNGHEFDR